MPFLLIQLSSCHTVINDWLMIDWAATTVCRTSVTCLFVDKEKSNVTPNSHPHYCPLYISTARLLWVQGALLIWLWISRSVRGVRNLNSLLHQLRLPANQLDCQPILDFSCGIMIITDHSLWLACWHRHTREIYCVCADFRHQTTDRDKSLCHCIIIELFLFNWSAFSSFSMLTTKTEPKRVEYTYTVLIAVTL